MREDDSSTMKDRYANISLLLFSLFLCVVFFEAVLRIKGYPVHGSSNRIDHEILDFVINPKLRGIDDQGFRNRSVLKEDNVCQTYQNQQLSQWDFEIINHHIEQVISHALLGNGF